MPTSAVPTTLVFSIKPKWVHEILKGRKLYELRRRPPKLIHPTPTIVYSTAPECKLRIQCLFWPPISDTPQSLWNKAHTEFCVSRTEYNAYFQGVDLAHAIPITGVVELEPKWTLKRLQEMLGFVAPQSWTWAKPELVRTLGASP